MTEQEIRAIADSMNVDDVFIYTQADCGYCEAAKQWLEAHGFRYTECAIDRDAGCAATYRGYGATGTPFLVVRRNGGHRHLRNGFTSVAFLAAVC